MDALEQQLHQIFVGKMPALSENAKGITKKILPWFLIVCGALGLLASLLLGVSLIANPLGLLFYGLVFLHLVIALSASLVASYAGYLMLSGKCQGWKLAYYAFLIGIVNALLSLSIIGLVLNCIFGYLLFQIKSDYCVVP